MGFESFPGIKGMALNFMMDNGLMDDAPKQALARFAPGAKDSGGPLVQQLSIAQTSPAGNGSCSQSVGGADMNHPEGVPGGGARDTTCKESPLPKPQQPGKSYFEPQPNGDLRIGNDIFLRWKTLPDPTHDILASALTGGLGVVGKIGTGATKIADAAGIPLSPLFREGLAWGAGVSAEQLFKGYLDKQFRWPWLEYEPAPQQPGLQDSTQDQAPKPNPQDSTQDQVPNA